jgi:AcrR family transcriptional regulator
MLSSVPEVAGNVKNKALLEQRRKELVECATAVFIERRFDKASVNDIAERCGWSIGSLYRYVSSKEDILVLVCDEIFRNLSLQNVGQAADGDPVTAFSTAFGAYCDNVRRNRKQVLLMYREYTQLSAEAQQHFRKLESAIYDSFASIVEDGVAQGVFACPDTRLFAVDCVMRAHLLALKTWAIKRTSYRRARAYLIEWALKALQCPDPVAGPA